jgi:putative phosphoribosyl transferase
MDGENIQEVPVTIPVDDLLLPGDLIIPQGAQGLVVFAHGSGSSRHSTRNQYVARVLHGAGLATLLFDLLTAAEEKAELSTHHLRFDIDLLAGRMVAVTDWLQRQPEAAGMHIGYFGASTGAAAALVAAAQRPAVVHAVVSRGGRPDLAERALPEVTAPTLLIVGGDDTPVIAMNQTALEQLQSTKKLEIIPGAGHLFEEQGTLEEAARLASNWFYHYLLETPSR